MITGLKFPAEPCGSYWTAPIYLEPIMGSGERIAIAVCAAGNGESRVENVLRWDTLECLYGAKSDQFNGLITMVTSSLKTHLDTGGAVESWAPPIRGVSVGIATITRADNIAHAISLTVRQHASLGYLASIADEDEEIQQNRKDSVLKSWVENIRAVAISQNPFLTSCFNVSIPLDKGDNARFGFIRQGYAAQFGMMSTQSSQHANRCKDAKVKLWDLQNLEIEKRELILAVPREDDPWMADKKVSKRIHNTLESLVAAAQKSRMSVIPMNSATEAANHLMKMAA
jgi:hypothetical protein